jgi:CARDB
MGSGPRWAQITLLGASITALALSVSPAAAKKPPRHTAAKPDLTAKADIAGDPYLFYGQTRSTITITDTVVNHGTGRAGPSLTRVLLEHDGKYRLLADRAVPAIGPGRTDSGEDTVVHANHLPLGAYKVVVCADAKSQEAESDEANNCVKLTNPRYFFVAAASWQGSLSGSLTAVGDGELTERWSSNDASLDFDQYEHGGIFTYLFNGSVTWTDSGIDSAGCTISGAGEDTFHGSTANGQLTVDYLKGDYITGGISEEGGAYYPLTYRGCPDPTSGAAIGPLQRVFWEPEPLGAPIRLPFGSTTLPGSPSSVFQAAWTWNLQRKAPSG